MPPRTIQLLLEVNFEAVPIAGTLQQPPDGRIEQFNGWLQLTETLEAIRRSAVRDASQERKSSPSTTPS
jgi:hypothetical protein